MPDHFDSLLATSYRQARPSASQSQITIGPPNLVDAKGSEEHEARRVHVGQLVAPKPLQLLDRGGLMLGSERKKLEPRELPEGETNVRAVSSPSRCGNQP